MSWPTPGGDFRTWGTKLLAILQNSHNEDGSIKDSVKNDLVAEIVPLVPGGAKGDKGDPGEGLVELPNSLGVVGGFMFDADTVTSTSFGADGKPVPEATALIAGALTDEGYTFGGGGAVNSVNGATGAVVLDTSGTNLLQAIDIWDGVNNTTLGITTYADYITTIDTMLASEITAGTVTKTQIGTSSDGSTPIWCYTYGSDDVPHVLLDSGLHANEGMGMHAGLRFFTEFVQDDHEVMAALRQRVKLSWIACLCPEGYMADRYNFNGADVNRNFQFLNGIHPQSVTTAQPEMEAVRDFIINNPIMLVIDCHTEQIGVGRDEYFMYGVASDVAGVNRNFGTGAIGNWVALYNTTGVHHEPYWSGPVRGDNPIPTPGLGNWAAKYIRYDLGRTSGASFLIDCGRLLAGSTDNTDSTAEAMRLYCGMIHMALVTWLQHGPTADTVSPRTVTAARTTTDHATAIGSGGTLIANNTPADLYWDTYIGHDGTDRPYLYVPLRCEGDFLAEVSIVLQGDAAATDHKEVELTYDWGVRGSAASLGTSAPYVAYASVPPGGGRTVLHHTVRLDAVGAITDNMFAHELRVNLRLLDGTTDPVTVLSAALAITHRPMNFESGDNRLMQ